MWKPSKTQRREFAKAMSEIEDFCAANGISHSVSSDSYYFAINGQEYRVSNHSVEASNAHAYDPLTHERRRDLYHPAGRSEDVVYIHAGKTRIIEIYNDLKAGYKLNGRGARI